MSEEPSKYSVGAEDATTAEANALDPSLFHEMASATRRTLIQALMLAEIADMDEKIKELRAWQPIDTAPRDGTPVLLCNAKTGSMRWAVWAQHPSHIQYPEVGWRDGTIEARGEIVGLWPTHWMPLPPPPSGEGEVARSASEISHPDMKEA